MPNASARAFVTQSSFKLESDVGADSPLSTLPSTSPDRDYPDYPERRWPIALLLGLGILVNFFDRVNLSVSHDALQHDFGISNITFGYLSGAYSWTYALCQLPIGVLLDRFGVRVINRISIFLWGLASFAAALSPTVASFFGARLLLGVAEAPTFPANTKALGLWFPPEQRGFATAISDSAAKFASAIGVPLIGILLIHVGWRWSFAATGFVSLIYFALFYRIYRDPHEVQASSTVPGASVQKSITIADEVQSEVDDSDSLSLTRLMRQPKVIGLALGSGSYNYVFYLLLTWLPTYLSYTLHLDLLHSFLFTGVPWLFATVTDLLIGGVLVDSLIRRGYDAITVRRIFLAGGTAMGLGILGAAHAHSATTALIWISISIGGVSASAPVGWCVPSLIAPRKAVGRVAGIMNFSNQLSGISAPVITGYLVAATHSFASAFIAAAIYIVIGVFGYTVLLGRIEPWKNATGSSQPATSPGAPPSRS
jgi:ACS family D-galactonate transporter-like MFS transporter